MPQPSSAPVIGLPFIELQSIDSTNNYARQLVHAGLAYHGCAVFAHEQTEGKGQRGKTWITEKDQNIILSIVINPFPLLLQNQFRLSAVIAVSVLRFLNRYTADECTIKWPNDIYWQDRKAGGILIENIINGKPLSKEDQWISIIGTGINVNQTVFPSGIQNPVSLKQITGKSFDPVLLAKELCGEIEKGLEELHSAGFPFVLDQYNQSLYKKGSIVQLKEGPVIIEALIKAVSEDGKLVISHAFEEELDYGTVEWLIR